jgi:TonB family protein
MKKQHEKYWLIIVLLASAFSVTCNAQKATRIIRDSTNNEHLPSDYYESMPSFPGGDAKLMNYIKKNINYPLEDKAKGIEGKVIVRFTVTKTGKVKDARVLRGLSKQIDEEAIRIVNTLPNFIPGTLAKGKPADIEYTLPIVFKIEPTNNVYEVVEKMPQFPGGDGALMTFVANSINYPPDGDLVGKTVIKFIITKDGFINNIKVLQSFDPICDKEAIRVINLLPKWIPGEHNGKKVNVYYTLPVIFRLQQ